MLTQSADFDITTAILDLPKNLCYGTVRGSGNLVFQHELADKTRLATYLLGEGPWDSILRLWINRKQITLPDTNKAHFHPGLDGEIGFGMGASSTGGDNHVDAFWSGLPGTLSVTTYSRYAYLMVKVPPDPGAPSPELEVLGDYKATKCRIFDNTGAQTSFAWTDNPAWWICDLLIRKFILREAKVAQPLIAAEKNRFDWQSFVDAATYFDADIGGGIKRFSDGGLVFRDQGLTADRALEQMLLLCRSYLLERGGKFTLYADKARASVFTFAIDNVDPLSFQPKKSNLRQGKNQVTAKWREMALSASSSDDATRFAEASNSFGHAAHQRAIGARGPGISVLPKQNPPLQLDYGNNTAERVARLAQYQLIRQLGDDVDAEQTYIAPFQAEWTGYEDSLAIEPGDLVTIDGSISEEFAGKLIEVLEVGDKPDGMRSYVGLEYQPNAFTDVAPTQQGSEAPTPGTGLPLPAGGELIRNPNFEFGDSEWIEQAGWSIVSDSVNAYQGSWVGKFVGAAAAAIRNNVKIAVQPGDLLLATCMCKRTAGDATVVALRITWFTSADVELSSSYGNSVTGSTYAVSRVVGTAPASAYYARVEAAVTNMTVSTTAYFDQFNASLFPRNLDEIADGPSFRKTGAAYVDPGNRPIKIRRTVGGVDVDADDISKQAEVTSHIGGLGVSTVGLESKVTDGSTRFARTAVHSSYRPLGNYLTATDAGANATVSIAAGVNRVGATDVSVNTGSITVLSYDTLYYIYYDDASLAGGAVAYSATTTKETALAANGRFFWGSIRTPKAGAPGTIGNNDGGAGAQSGSQEVLLFGATAATGTGTTTNPNNALDVDLTTSADVSALGDTVTGRSATFTLSDSPAKYSTYQSLTLKIRSEAIFSGTGTGGGRTVRLRYSTDGGTTWTTIFNLATTRALQTDSATLPTAINLALVRVEAFAESLLTNTGTLTATVKVYGAWIEGVS